MAPMAPAIRLDRVSKRFVLSGRPETVRELIPVMLRAAVGRAGVPPVERWALRDVSLTVAEGETLGVIGRNGAGKSTLLRLLSRILRPSSGRVEVRGRVSALIELSAGFHFELPARDNVVLQGAILGMRRREIARRFDAIVEFAGLSEFVEVPLKRYSTGMVSRLGFAIATHLDTEVLLVDEVLAVGDRAFAQKAVAHLKQIVRDGRAVVLVSHQLDRIAELCSHAVLLRDGRVAASGPVAECIAAYVGADDPSPPPCNGRPVRVTSLSLRSDPKIRCGDRLTLRLCGTVSHPSSAHDTTVGLRVRALPSDEAVFRTDSGSCGTLLPSSGDFELEIALDMNVGPGLYCIESLVGEPDSDRAWSRGPSTLVRVERRPSTIDQVYLNPAMRLVARR